MTLAVMKFAPEDGSELLEIVVPLALTEGTPAVFPGIGGPVRERPTSPRYYRLVSDGTTVSVEEIIASEFAALEAEGGHDLKDAERWHNREADAAFEALSKKIRDGG